KRRRCIMHCDSAEGASLIEIHRAKLGFADARRVSQHGLEHRLQFARRTADDLEHLRRRSLLLQAFAQLIEQPRILDGNDGLGGEVLHQLNLLIGEWPYLLSVDNDDADQFGFLEHRYAKKGAGTAEHSRGGRYVRFGRNIGTVQQLLRLGDAAERAVSWRDI